MILNKIAKITLLLTVVSLFACNYNSSRMIKTDKNYPFDAPPQNNSSEYIISISDIIEFKLYTNDGTALVDLTAISEERNSIPLSSNFQYLVEFDGFVKLPIIGRTDLKGKSIREVEKLLEETYSKYYIKPFVVLKVINRRVTVFPGGGGKGAVLTLKNENTTLIEALGSVGGITKLAKATHVKLIRGELKNPKVYIFDLSTIDGIKQTDFVLQANDIIYVEYRSDAFRELIRDIAPVLSLITSAITLFVVINSLK